MPPRSRQTRNQDAANRSRGGGQTFDLDPTDGLPVQKYALQTIRLNQDASASSDPSGSINPKATTSAEWASQFDTPQFPWSEPQFPSFFKELSPWNQELIRRARAGNTNAKLSVWDRKTNSWMSAAEAEIKATPLKSVHLNNVEKGTGDKTGNGDADSQKSNEDSDANDSSNESNQSAAEDEDDPLDEATPFKPSTSKRRKLASRLNGPDETRIIEVKKWVQLPAQLADRQPETSFLAARRPGMPPLYQPEYATKMFGQFHSSATLSSGGAGYDLGEGGGLSNASGVLAAGTAEAGNATPQRKNIPPRRKKKKLGGPGRRKAIHNQVPQSDGPTEAQSSSVTRQGGTRGEGAMEGVESTNQDGKVVKLESDVKNEAGEGDENEGSGSEAEGSEEGEIDESGGAGHSHEVTNTNNETTVAREGLTTEDARPELQTVPTTTATTRAPEVTITDTEMQETGPQPEPPLIEKRVSLADITNPIPTKELTKLPSPPEVGRKSTTDPTAPTSEETTRDHTTKAVPIIASTSDVPPHIPGLSEILHPEAIQDEEEKAIIEETAAAITLPETTEREREQEQQDDDVQGLSEGITQAIAGSKEEVAQQDVNVNVGETGGAEGEDEMDLLGAMDAAIDRGMSEGDGS